MSLSLYSLHILKCLFSKKCPSLMSYFSHILLSFSIPNLVIFIYSPLLDFCCCSSPEFPADFSFSTYFIVFLKNTAFWPFVWLFVFGPKFTQILFIVVFYKKVSSRKRSVERGGGYFCRDLWVRKRTFTAPMGIRITNRRKSGNCSLVYNKLVKKNSKQIHDK